MTRVLIVDDAPITVANIERLLKAQHDMEVCGKASDAATALALTASTQPDVVLLDMGLPLTDGPRAAAMITKEFPAVAIIATGVEDDEAARRAAGETGAREYLVKPFAGRELLAAIVRVRGHVPPGPNAGEPATGATRPPSAPPLPAQGALSPAAQSAPVTTLHPPPQSAVPGPGQNQVVVVTSAKGGAGASVLATNLALLIAGETRKRVALVDLDLQHGDLRQLLRLDATASILDVVAESPTADKQALLRRLVDGPSGVMALLAPATPRLPVSLDPGFVAPLFQELRQICDLVVVDLPSYLTGAGAAALRSADRVVVVSGMSEPAVRATAGLLATLAGLSVAAQRVLIVLNRNEANSDLTKAMVEETIGWPTILQFPYDPILVSTSINRGIPFVIDHPDAQISRKLRDLAGALVPIPATTVPPPSHPPTPGRRDDRNPEEPRKPRRGLFGFTKG